MKTLWYISAKVKDISNFKLIIYELMNWINHVINTNNNYYFIKKYIIISYLLNLSL